MAETYTEEQLNRMDKGELSSIAISLQERLAAAEENYKNLNHTMQIVLEELADAKRHRFGRSSERFVEENPGQLTFMDSAPDRALFNEAEAVNDSEGEEAPEERPAKKRGTKKKGKRKEDIADLPVTEEPFDLTEEQLNEIFGGKPYKRLPDETQDEYFFRPAEVGIHRKVIAVYASADGSKMVRADHPKNILPPSLVSPSLAAAIMNGKYASGMPLYRQETVFRDDGVNITRKSMAEWVIKLSDKYLSVMYDRIHRLLLERHVIHADETPLLVNKDGRPAGSKSYMWVYRTGVMDKTRPLILYEYQKTRKADHPREFLKDFSGVCVTDGYQVYHTVEGEMEDLKIAGCWAHARRKYDEALKALPKAKRKGAIASTALKLIQAIFDAESALKELPPDERLKRRQESVAPLVDAYFEWIKTNRLKVMSGTKTDKGMQYSLNQEKYLRVFLTDGEVAMDNNGAERAIRPFCVGKKNWEFCDTISGAKASAVVYSIVETAKANGLRPYYYLEYLLTEIPKHLYGNQFDLSFVDGLLPWSDNLPDECHKVVKEQ